MPKVAILKTVDRIIDDYCTQEVISSITEWQEVTNEDLILLKRYMTTINYGYVLIEFPDQEKTVKFCVKACLEKARDIEEKQRKDKEDKEKAALARKEKKEKKDLESKRKLLEQLKQELEGNS